jgi:hypothetical protein
MGLPLNAFYVRAAVSVVCPRLRRSISIGLLALNATRIGTTHLDACRDCSTKRVENGRHGICYTRFEGSLGIS